MIADEMPSGAATKTDAVGVELKHVQTRFAKRRVLLWLVGITVADCCWLVWTMTEQEDKRLFFGLWKLRHILVALAGAWLAVTIMLWFLLRRRFVMWIICNFWSAAAVLLAELAGFAGVISYPKLFTAGDSLGTQEI